MKYEKDDYVIALPETGKAQRPFFMKITGIHKGIATGTLEKDCHIIKKRTTVEVPVANIIAVLTGDEPFRGKAYGCDTSVVYRGRKTHEKFGSIAFFYKPETEAGEKIMKAFDKAYKLLKAQRLEFLVNPETTQWEVTPPNGERYAGMWKHSRDTEKNPHRGIIRPEVMEAKDFPYVIIHELGHNAHFGYLKGSKLEGEWVKLYKETIKVNRITKEDSQRILDMILEQEALPSDFKGQLEEDDQEIFKAIVKQIKTQHRISLKELDLLFEADFKDDIREIWPLRGVIRQGLEPLVSEYSLKNVNELIAESFAFYMTGMEIPKKVKTLLEKTLSYIRTKGQGE